MEENPVSKFISGKEKWQRDILNEIRDAILTTACPVKETIKWGSPTYVGKKNIVGMTAMKNFVSLWFYQGVLLQDKEGCLIAANENTKALRQMRFLPEQEVNKRIIAQYFKEAYANDLSEKKWAPPEDATPPKSEVPEELKSLFAQNSRLQINFEALPLYKQKEFIEFLATAKREDTKVRRLEKVKKHLEENTGLHDKYRK